MVKPPVDAIAEFKVVTADSSAEYGYRPGAKVLVSTRSGGNSLHGSAYEFLRNEKLDGTNFFANRSGSAKPSYRQNQFGGALGGHIIRNKTFFFGSYQGTRIRLGQSFVSSVPSLAVRGGDFSGQPAQRRNIFDPMTLTGTGNDAARLPFPGNRIPASRFDPVAKRVADIYPAPNISGRDELPNNFFFGPVNSDDANQYDGRVDHYISDSQRVFVRYSRRSQNKLKPGPLPLPADGALWQTSVLSGNNLVVNYSATLSSAIHNEVRVGYIHFPGNHDLASHENFNQLLGVKGAPGDSFGDNLNYGLARFQIAGFNILGSTINWPNLGQMNDFQLGDNLLWQKGRHGLKFGGEFRRLNISRAAQGQRRGFFDLNGQYTAQFPNVAASRAGSGNGMADMLLGWADNQTYGNGRGETIISPYYAGYVQDDFKVTSRLTLNVGLRWELFLTPYFPDPEHQSVSRYLTPELDGIAPGSEHFVFPKDGRDCGCRNSFHNFAPRLGFAYRLNDATRSSLRRRDLLRPARRSQRAVSALFHGRSALYRNQRAAAARDYPALHSERLSALHGGSNSAGRQRGPQSGVRAHA